MADRIDDIVGQEAYEQVTKLDKMMGDLVTKFDLVAKSALSMQVAIGDTKKINEVISAQQKQAKSLDEIERLETKLANTMTLKAQLMQEIKSKQQEEVLNNKAFIKSVQAQEGSINQLRLQLNQATKAYDAMAKAERESGKGTTLLTNIQNTTTALKALEANTGRFQRNVGNYTNSTFQLTQVMRELPNFAQSAEIGIRSLSNNLPMLADSFGQVRKEAGGTIPALKIFASSLFTFAGIFPLVLAGLIAYSKEIMEFGKSLFTTINYQKELNDALLEGTKNATNEAKSLERLYKATQDTTLSLEQRKKAVDELQKQYPEYFANINDEIILNGGATKQYDDLTKSILATARAKAIESKITEIINKDLDKELELMDKQAKAIDYYNKNKGKSIFFGGYGAGSGGEEKDVNRLNAVAVAEKELSDFKRAQNEKLKVLEDAIDKEDKIITKHGGSIINNKPSTSNKSASSTRTTRAKAQSTSKAKDNSVDIVQLTDREQLDQLARLDEQIKTMGEKADSEWIIRTKKRLDEIKRLNEQYAKMETDLINENLVANGEMWDKADAERIERLNFYAETISQVDELSNILTDALSNKIQTQAEKELEFIDEKEKRELDALDRLSLSQTEKEERKKKIELEAEARRQKIEKEKIKDLRKFAIFQKGIDTAEIISKIAIAIASGNIPTAIAGGVALAKVLATPLPQYEFGIGIGNGEHKGGKAIVGEVGSELGRTPDGELFLTPSQASIMDLPAKTKIIPHDITKEILGATMINLAKTNQSVTLDKFQLELINSFERTQNKVIDELKRSKTNITFNGDMADYIYTQSKIM